MAKKQVVDENYLERKPVRKPGLSWKQDDESKVTLEIENKGFLYPP